MKKIRKGYLFHLLLAVSFIASAASGVLPLGGSPESSRRIHSIVSLIFILQVVIHMIRKKSFYRHYSS